MERGPRLLDQSDWSRLRPALAEVLPASGIWRRAHFGPRASCPTFVFVYGLTRVEHLLMPGIRSTDPDACDLTMYITDGALQLPADELEAAMAHDAGHYRLGHAKRRHDAIEAECRGRVSFRDCPSKVFQPFPVEEERAADRYAVELLNTMRPGGCASLVALVRRLATTREPVSATAHPGTAERLQVIQAACRVTR